MITDLNLIIAIATARIFVGILFFFQGYDKIFNIGMKQLRQTMSANLGNHKLPDSMWDTAHVFVRLLLILLLLLTPVEWDKFSFDYLFTLAKLKV